MAMKSIMRIKSSNSIHNKTLSKMNNSNSKINASSLAKTQKYFKPRNNPHYPILKKISDENDNTIAEYEGYVPELLSIKEKGYGDYLEFEINKDCKIPGWRVTQDLLEDFEGNM